MKNADVDGYNYLKVLYNNIMLHLLLYKHLFENVITHTYVNNYTDFMFVIFKEKHRHR